MTEAINQEAAQALAQAAADAMWSRDNAAKALGMVQRGTKQVELLVLKNAGAPCPGGA